MAIDFETHPGLRLAARHSADEQTRVRIGAVEIGGGEFTVIAGPCAVESHDQIRACAEQVKLNGCQILRGGCFKGRTSPYSFQGLGSKGLELLALAGAEFQLPTITEVLGETVLEEIENKADILQVGARNMQNYSLLRAVGRSRRPVLLKRHMSASIHELLSAAEYILSEGNPNVILCERGIRTFEHETRFTLDISAVPLLRLKTHLPIVVDPSHAAGRSDIVIPLALAARAAGAHGLMVEIHPDPGCAQSDSAQALSFEQFASLCSLLRRG